MFKKWAKIASAALLALSVTVTGLGVKPAEAAANATPETPRYEQNYWMATLLRTYSQRMQAAATPVAVQSATTMAVAKPQPLKPTVAGMEFSKMLHVKASSYGPGNINWKYG